MSDRVGILGGIGPEATGVFYLRLIKELQKSGRIKSNRDFPQIIINSIPAPELVRKEVSDEELLPYVSGLQELDGLNLDFIVMVCNTIHNYHKMLQSKIKTPIIDLKSEFERFTHSNKIKSVVLVGTPSTVNGNLFRISGIKYHELTKNESEMLSDLILKFNSGNDKTLQSKRLEEITKKHIQEGAELAILCCTEVSLMLKDSKLKKVDTMDILRDAVLRRLKD